MLINNIDYRTVWMQDSSVYMINQLLLPFKFEIYQSKDYIETANAIKTMIVRGAPAIGATAAYGLAQAALLFEGYGYNDFKEYVDEAFNLLNLTRPTAIDLKHGLNFVKSRMFVKGSIANSKMKAFEAAAEYADLSAESCKKIGGHGNEIIKNNQRILTHCNAGALACVDFGTALAPIRIAHYNNKNIFVFVDETRPRNQGFLTAWELSQEKISHAIIADNAAGFFMKKKEVDLAIVGADRIALNGDAANKIGTYEKAVLAKENNIPFYVAAPLSTFDANSKTGNDIVIEERSEDEIFYAYGMSENKNLEKINIAPLESHARNPAFDITPAKYIKGIITEIGIIKPTKQEIQKLVKYGNEKRSSF
ncbi:S-methyl-5-thioribose-1-phosphate isomerase [Candidatus Woesearchaeota archaeon]|nr:S-methyl-5-thioribose-1-phosphate isomerase [Candidatus Woesearchaeota archaeon]